VLGTVAVDDGMCVGNVTEEEALTERDMLDGVLPRCSEASLRLRLELLDNVEEEWGGCTGAIRSAGSPCSVTKLAWQTRKGSSS
jgi:hypothetical protein